MKATSLALLLLGSAAAGAQAPPRVQLGVSVVPETVTVGDPFRIIVRVRAPAGATITFPDGPDAQSAVEALDPPQVRTSADSAAVEHTAVYRVAAWNVAEQAVPFADVAVRLNETERRIPLRDVSVFVRSVLPADTSLHDPKPARAPFDLPRPWWHLGALVAALVALLALLAWWLWRRRRSRPGALDQSVLDPFEHAQREFERIEALRLLEAGERGRYVALMVDVLREYLARRIAAAHPSLTSSELLTRLHGERGIPHERLAAVLHEADLIKFARRPVGADRAGELARDARAIVVETEQGQSAVPEPQREAA